MKNLSLLLLMFTALFASAQKKEKVGLFDRINNGIDKVNNSLNKVLGYKVIEGEWVRHGGGNWNTFGGWSNEQAFSPLNRTYLINYRFPGTPYGITLNSNATTQFGFAVYDPYGSLIYTTFNQNKSTMLDYIFTPSVAGLHKVVVFTARRAGDPLNDTGGKFVFSAQCESITPIENEIFIEENLSWGEKGGGGIGDPWGGGGSGDNTLFSPRNITYLIDAKQGTPIHVIIEPFGIETSLTLLNPYGQSVVAYSALELIAPISSDGIYKLIVATRDKGTNGRFNLIFAGNITSPPQRETPDVFLENNSYSAAFKKEFKINVHQTSYFDFYIASSENRCSLSILDASKNRITTAPNPWDRTIVKIEGKTIIYGILECQNHSNGFYDIGFFGDFNIVEGQATSNKPPISKQTTSLQSENIISGKVKNYQKNADSYVVLVDEANQAELQRTKITSTDGSFTVEIPEKTESNYLLFIEQKGVVSSSKKIEGGSSKRNFKNIDLELTSVTIGKNFSTNNILFQSGKATLLPESYIELNRIAEVIKSNDIKVEIGGHTDDVGNEGENQKLSLERAEAVKFYLLSKGISSNRLTIKGYGEDKPIATPLTEENRKLNRRVEFKFL